jgi:hypothetical protein
LAKAFQAMLERFDLTEKILAFNADNATANDKQTSKLDALDNSFEEANRVRCFNHTLQLSAKALLAPFNTAISRKTTHDDELAEADDSDELLPDLEADQDNDNDNDEVEDDEDKEDLDDGVDELQELSENERAQVMENTKAVRNTVTKVSLTKQKMFAF